MHMAHRQLDCNLFQRYTLIRSDAYTDLGVQVDGTRSMDDVFADIDEALGQTSSQHSSQQLAATA